MGNKVFSLITLLVVLLGIVSCGGENAPSSSPAPTEPQQAAAPTEPAVEPTATAEPEPTPVPTNTVTPTPTPEPTPAWQATFEQAPCPMDLPPGAVEGEHITCGYVTVPEARAEYGAGRGSQTIQLAVALIPSASDGAAPDPLVMLAGGPGQSAFEGFIPLLALPGMEGFWAQRDVVLVEQRGTQYSTPFLRCQEIADFRLDTLGQNLDEGEEDALRLAAWAACRDRFVEEGINLAAYNSLENAADIIDVLDALDYDRANLYGGSYGSLLAQHIMRDYPDRVRSVILDAVSPLRHEPNLLYKAHSSDGALRLLFEQCAADAACNEAYPDLEVVYFDLVEQLDAEPATLHIQNPETGEVHDLLLTGDRLVALTRDLLYITAILPDLPGAIYNMAAGDFGLLELIQARLLFNLKLADGLYNSVICTELADFSREDFADTAGLYPVVADVTEDLISDVMLEPCQVWGVEHLGGAVTKPVSGDIPTLLLSGEFDPTVPPHMAEVAAETLANAYLYTFPGIGHSTLGSSDCALAMMLAFLDDPAQAPDAACLDEMPGLTFRFPAAAVELEPFVDEARGFSGLVPVGWQAVAPANMARASSAIDPAYFVLEAQPVTAAEILAALAAQLGLDSELEPVATAELGQFTWDFYTLELEGFPLDLALAEDGGKAYFVFLVSPKDEHEALYNQLFLPAVEAMAPLE